MDKIEYIANQLRRTFNKKYENYCITRIYHLLNRDDVQIITQQMFRRDDGKIALADLYFPQLNIYIEIDEKQHQKTKIKDKQRKNEIKSYKKLIDKKLISLGEVINSKLTEIRIDVSCNDLNKINKKIDEVVENITALIKKRKKENKFIPWTNVYKTPDDYVNKKEIKVSQNVSLRTIQEVSELFNKGYKKGNRICYFSTSKNNEMVWCPTLKVEDDDCKSNDWENEMSRDGKYIYEINKKDDKLYEGIEYGDNEIRIVFPKYKDATGLIRYKFKGIYELNRNLTNKKQQRVWEKIGDSLNLEKYFKK